MMNFKSHSLIISLWFLISPAVLALDTLPKQKIMVGEVTLLAEIAKTESQKQKGLMFREKLGEDDGMLFVFTKEERLVFWMRNTLIPLSIGFFDNEKTLVDIKEMEPASPMDMDPPTYKSAKPAIYALEANKGWFKRKNIKLSAKLKF